MGDDEKHTSFLLELSAADNLEGFRHAVEYEGFDVDEVGLWYGRRIGSRKMGFEEMTPLLISSLYGSFHVLNYILTTGKVDVNRASGSNEATALHFAAASGLDLSAEVVQLLINASADVNARDVNGNRPADLIAPMLKNSNHLKRRELEMMFRGGEAIDDDQEDYTYVIPQLGKEMVGGEKKEYAVDVPLPDINNGVYSTDEFRMYSFKVKPCSRAYSHDWTECPFVHPGENARRRDPTKFQYTCVPCPEFRKGSCAKADNCEYAHGVFESWLHPAQYRTRLCKDEMGCSRKVCFFAHKHDELRPLYASTGSALPSPKTVGPMDMTPPMSPLANKVNLTALQLPSSRLKTAALKARNLELELMRLDNQRQQQQLIDELSGFSSLETVFDPSPSSQLHAHRSSSSILGSSSPVRKSSPFGFDSSGAMNLRSSGFANRSQSFIDRGTVNSCNRPVNLGLTAAANSAGLTSSKLGDWGSPDGKLEWGFSKEDETNKLKKSASFGYRNYVNANRTTMAPSTFNQPGLHSPQSNFPWAPEQFYMLEQEKIY